ncbi:hypothetical protein [Desulfosoma sp.]|uniref:Uncharacterized protein n=1 Tax=Desulfacinum infernum TaxID=35837 RepID=A0A832A174_9BACT
MCLHQKRLCECGRNEAYVFHRDSILPEEVLVHLYCPECAASVAWNARTMVRDGGWILEYDMEAACFYLGRRLGRLDYTPEDIFDEDYCSWYGLTPMDLEASRRLHEELEPLKRDDLKAYIHEMTRRRLDQVHILKRQGWRKAARA